MLTNCDQLGGQFCWVSVLGQLAFSSSLSLLSAGDTSNLSLLSSNLTIISWWKRRGREGKKHNFGVKRSWEQRTFLNFKKQTPVDFHISSSIYSLENKTSK